MKNLINKFILTYCTEVYEMPLSDLELKMDNHKCIEWGNKEYFIAEENSLYNEDEELIHMFLIESYQI